MPAEFQRDYLLRLPLPAAQLYSRAHNAKSARGRHDNAFYLCEALVKLAAAPLVACYLHEMQHGQPRVEALDRVLLQLALPSLGQWLAIVRELSRYFGQRVDAASHPLGRLHEQLTRPQKLPGALALYRRIKNGPDGPPAGDQSCSVLQVLEALVQYRNQVLGHGGPRFDSFFENEMGPLLLPAVNDLFAEHVVDWLGPAGARLAYLTEIRTVDESQVEIGLRELVGRDSERATPVRLSAEAARDLLPNRVVLLWPGRPAPLRLDPMLIYRETDQGEDVLFLNRDRNSRQVEYLSYFSGRTERETSMKPALTALLSQIAGKGVSEERLAEFQAQSLAETPSVEMLTGEQPLAGQVLGDYALLGVLGRGGMGVVYLARQISLGRLVALKTLPADLAGDEVALARLRREIRALGRCEHPNIVKVLTSGALPDGQPYYVMEYVPGCDLERVWQELSGGSGSTAALSGSSWRQAVLTASKKQRKQTQAPVQEAPGAPALPLPELPEPPQLDDRPGSYVRRVVGMLRDAARAVQAVHEQNLIHRDVKPANLMLTPDGERVVLMDFGLAKGNIATRPLTTGGGLLGTLRYAAPEQLAAANLKVGPEADVRGLGITLWEMLTRRRLFAEAQDEIQLAQLIHDNDVPRLRSLDRAFDRDLEAIVARATERRVADRIATARQLADYLQLWLDGRPLPIRTPGVGELLRRWTRAHKPLVSSVAAALLVIVAAVAIAFALITAALENERDAKTLAQQRLEDRDRAYGALQTKQDELAGETARSWLRPLALQRSMLMSDMEVEALYAIAAKRGDPLIVRFFEEGLKEPQFTQRLGTRSEYALHAAIGLDLQRRGEVEELLLKRLQTSGLAVRVRTDLALALADLGDISPTTAAVVAPALAEAVGLAKGADTGPALARGLISAATRLEPAKAAAMVSQAIAKTEHPETLFALAAGLKAITARMEPEEAAQATAQAGTRLTQLVLNFKEGGNETYVEFDILADALAAIAVRLEPGQAADAITEIIVSRQNAVSAIWKLEKSLSVVAKRLSAKQAGKVAKTLVDGMSKGFAYTELAKCLSLVAPRLLERDLDSAAATLTAGLLKQVGYGLDGYGIALSSIAVQMEPEKAAAMLMNALGKIDTAGTDPNRSVPIQRLLAAALALQARRLERKEAAKVCGQAANMLSKTIKDFPLLPRETHGGLAETLSLLAEQMEPKDAARVATAVVPRLMQDLAYGRWAVQNGFTLMLQWLEPDEARRKWTEAAALLAEEVPKAKTIYTGEVAAALAAVAAHLERKEAARLTTRAAETVLAVLVSEEVSQVPDRAGATASDLTALALWMEPQQGGAILAQASAKVNNPRAMRILAQGLVDVTAGMQPEEATRLCGEVGERLGRALARASYWVDLQDLAGGLSALAPAMDPKDRARLMSAAAGHVAQALAMARFEDVSFLAEALAVLAPHLEDKERARRLADASAQFDRLLSTARGHSDVYILKRGILALAAPMEPQQAAKVLAVAAARIMRVIADEPGPDRQRLIATDLVAVLGDRTERALAVTAALGHFGDAGNPLGRLLLVPAAMSSQRRMLSDREFVDLLKRPLCVGLARRAVLDELGYWHQRRFLDQWEFVRYVQEQHLELDLTTPVKPLEEKHGK